jgi:hypothetical protein
MMPLDEVKARGRAETDIQGRRCEAMKRYIDPLETITAPGPSTEIIMNGRPVKLSRSSIIKEQCLK